MTKVIAAAVSPHALSIDGARKARSRRVCGRCVRYTPADARRACSDGSRVGKMARETSLDIPMNPTFVKPPGAKSPTRSVADKPKARNQQRLTYLIASLDRLLRRQMGDALAPIGITLAQYTALSVLETRGALSNAQLAMRSFITPQSANEVTSALANRGYVAREGDPNHGRVILLRLTEEGAAVLRECERAVRPVERRMVGELSSDDAERAQRSLEIFVHNLND